MSEAVLRVSDLKTHFRISSGLFRRTKGFVRAVDGISFDVMPDETIGIVGESGCGKSTMLRSIAGLIKPTGGQIEFHGLDLAKLNSSAMRPIRQKVQMVFQDPYASLTPHLTVASIILEPMLIHHQCNRQEGLNRVAELLELVGLRAEDGDKYPHQFSGGQRQRIGIARALACQPELLLLDEPVAALDVSIQAQVLNLLEDLQKDLNLTYVFVSHDLSVVRYISNRVLVLKNGRMVEMAETEELFRNPIHAYTRSLLAAIPIPDPDVEQSRLISRNSVDAQSGATVQADGAFGQAEGRRPVWREVSPLHYVAV